MGTSVFRESSSNGALFCLQPLRKQVLKKPMRYTHTLENIIQQNGEKVKKKNQ